MNCMGSDIRNSTCASRMSCSKMKPIVPYSRATAPKRCPRYSNADVRPPRRKNGMKIITAMIATNGTIRFTVSCRQSST